MNSIIALNNNQQGINIHPNVCTSFSPEVKLPTVDVAAHINPLATVIDRVSLGKQVMVAPAASVRGDEDQQIWIGDDVNIQNCVVNNALETHVNGELVRVVHVDQELAICYQQQEEQISSSSLNTIYIASSSWLNRSI